MKNLISALTIQKLVTTGEDFGVPFCYPPFDDDATEGFFDIHDFKETKKWNDFIKIIEKMGVKYEYAFSKKRKDKRIFMVIKMGNK